MDTRKPFEKARPEEVGVPSKLILEYIENLEKSQTEMHGLMIMRHNKMITEGWWTPYGPNIRH